MDGERGVVVGRWGRREVVRSPPLPNQLVIILLTWATTAAVAVGPFGCEEQLNEAFNS
jgi:hypothetical protein